MLWVLHAQLLRRWPRSLALVVGLLVAVTSFTVLTGTAEASRLEVLGTVQANARAAFDILVRPAGTLSDREATTGLVRPNFLSDAPGGISLKQVEAIKAIPGVEVAAPIALIGVVVPELQFPIDLSDVVPDGERSAFRLAVEYRTDRGLSGFAQSGNSYVYFTPNPVRHKDSAKVVTTDKNKKYSYLDEVLPSGERVGLCGRQVDWASLSDARGSWERAQCFSLVDDSREYATGAKSFLLHWSIPHVLAAVDPDAEAALVGLDAAMVSGDYLTGADPSPSRGGTRPVPIIAATESYVDEQVAVTVERLPRATAEQFPGFGRSPTAPGSFAETAPGVPVKTMTVTSADASRYLLRERGHLFGNAVATYWVAGGVELDARPDGVLSPRAQPIDDVWTGAFGDRLDFAPAASADQNFRNLSRHQLVALPRLARLELLGRFDPARIAAFSQLSKVPLGAYQSPGLGGADDRSRALLGNQLLLPSSDPAGYLQQPPLLLTTMDAVGAFYGSYGRSSGTGPVSAVRIRVAGVTGIDDLSRERVRMVAERIAAQTGLHVDITVGSSPSRQTIALPAGDFGRPALTLTEWWSKKGVAIVIKDAVERKSLILFVLVLVVCALFVGNASAAAVRARRTELGVLACLGWTRGALFGLILGELVVLGLAAGVLGVGAAWVAGGWAGPQVSWARAALAVPAAIGVAVLAGLHPAIAASRADPMSAVRPAVSAGRRTRLRFGIASLAAANLRRTPGRTLLGAGALAVATAALTLLAAITWAFQGTLVGSLLGEAVTVQVRGPDVAAVIAMLVLATVAVGDVIYLNIRDRAAEFATLHATGWTGAAIARLILIEAVTLAALGATSGAVLGTVLATALAGGAELARLGPVLMVVTIAGVALAVIASLLPIHTVRRHPTATLLTEE